MSITQTFQWSKVKGVSRVIIVAFTLLILTLIFQPALIFQPTPTARATGSVTTNYTFRSTTGTFTPLTGGTVITGTDMDNGSLNRLDDGYKK